MVDPFLRVIGIANVPPQQKDWWAEVIREKSKLRELLMELMQFVVNDVADFSISLEEAEKAREEQMEERRAFVEDVNAEYESEEFNFL